MGFGKVKGVIPFVQYCAVWYRYTPREVSDFVFLLFFRVWFFTTVFFSFLELSFSFLSFTFFLFFLFLGITFLFSWIEWDEWDGWMTQTPILYSYKRSDKVFTF